MSTFANSRDFGCPRTGGAFALLVCLWVCALLLSGCSLLPSPSPRPDLPIPVEISIAASEALNPDEHGRPSPVFVRIYELSGAAFFQSADYFSLLGESGAVDQAEVIEMHEFTLMPGEIRVLRHRAERGVRFLGVAAAYRDLGSVWRAFAGVPAPRKAGRVWSKEASPQQRYRVIVGEKSVTIDNVKQ